MDIKAQLLDEKIKEFEKFVVGFSKMFNDGHLSHNMWRSELTNLRLIKERVLKENELAQAELVKIQSFNQDLKAQGEKELENARGSIFKMMEKARATVKEVQRLLSESESRRIEDHIKELFAQANEDKVPADAVDPGPYVPPTMAVPADNPMITNERKVEISSEPKRGRGRPKSVVSA